MGKSLPQITIVRDTREQNGWTWTQEEKRPGRVQIVGTEVTGLDAGDYSIVNALELIRIERKNGFGELFGNYSPKEHKDRFEREMVKFADVRHKYILVETLLTTDTFGLTVPQYGYGNSPPASRIIEWLTQIGLDHNVHVMFVGDSGKRVARTIFEQVARKYL